MLTSYILVFLKRHPMSLLIAKRNHRIFQRPRMGGFPCRNKVQELTRLSPANAEAPTTDDKKEPASLTVVQLSI